MPHLYPVIANRIGFEYGHHGSWINVFSRRATCLRGEDPFGWGSSTPFRLPARINGQNVEVLVDTGPNHPVLGESLATKLGLSKISVNLTPVHIAGG